MPASLERVELPFEQALAAKLDQAFGPLGGQRQQPRTLAGAEDDGFVDRHDERPLRCLERRCAPAPYYLRCCAVRHARAGLGLNSAVSISAQNRRLIYVNFQLTDRILRQSFPTLRRAGRLGRPARGNFHQLLWGDYISG